MSQENSTNVADFPLDIAAIVTEINRLNGYYGAATASPSFNTKEVQTTSGTWTAPVTGWYRVTCVGGGGAGGSNGCRGGGGGGTTSFGSYLSASGGGGGAGSSRQNFTSGSGGGASGDVAVTYLRLTASSSISVTIGAGGEISTTDMTNATGTGAGTVYNLYGNAIAATGAYNFGGAARGAGNGSINFMDSGHGASAVGGNGGSNGTGYGGGGGGSTNGYYIGQPGRGGDNGSDAEAKTSATGVTQCNGGNGGSGAVIIEYFNPAVTA